MSAGVTVHRPPWTKSIFTWLRVVRCLPNILAISVSRERERENEFSREKWELARGDSRLMASSRQFQGEVGRGRGRGGFNVCAGDSMWCIHRGIKAVCYNGEEEIIWAVCNDFVISRGDVLHPSKRNGARIVKSAKCLIVLF